MSTPLFPSLTPKSVDPLWFSVDQPWDDETEVAQLENEHQQWLNSFQKKHEDLIPIGKTASEVAAVDDDDEEEDEEEVEDEEESEEGSEGREDDEEEELSMEISYERNQSPSANNDNVSIRMVQGHGVR